MIDVKRKVNANLELILIPPFLILTLIWNLADYEKCASEANYIKSKEL